MPRPPIRRSAGRHALLTLLAAGALAFPAFPTPAAAQSPEEVKLAKQTAGEGLAAYQKGEFEKALSLFSQARAVYPSANVVRMLGYSELALEHWVKALDALEASLDAKVSPLSKDDRKEVEEQIAKAAAHVGTLKVTSKVTGALLAVDGGEPRALLLVDKPIRLVEGPHKLVVTAPDHLDAAQEVKVEGGKSVELDMEPPEKPKPKPPPPPPPPPPKPTRKGWVPHQREVGLGAAGGGVLFGIAALATTIEWVHWRSLATTDYNTHVAEYGPNCNKGNVAVCQFDVRVTNQEADTADKLRNVSLGLGVTAGVLGAAGLVFYFTAPKKAAPPPADAAPPPPPALPFPGPGASASPTLACGLSGGGGVLCQGAF